MENYVDKVWDLFWKIFGLVFAAALVVSVILGIARQSGEFTAELIQKVFVMGVGICGVIAVAIVPVEMYFTDKLKRGGVSASGNENDVI